VSELKAGRKKMSRIKELLFVASVSLGGCLCESCTGPYYTWSYAHTASPVATASYIRAVMAAEAGQDEIALKFYDAALSREYSEKVKLERDAVAARLKAAQKSQNP